MHIKISRAKILVIVMGGGTGTRLFPLTKDTPVDRRAASDFGIMHSDADRRIFR